MTDAPRVDVDPTMTKKWLKLTNSNTASLAELAILNNLEIVAHQNRHIMGTQEKIMAAITSIQTGGRTGSSGNAGGEGGKQRSSGAQRKQGKAGTGATEAEVAMNALRDGFQGFLDDQFAIWVSSTNKKVYVTRTKNVEPDAKAFFEQLVTIVEGFAEDDGTDHPMLPHLRKLNRDLEVTFYVGLGKQHKKKADAEKKKKQKEKATGAAAKQTTGRGSRSASRAASQRGSKKHATSTEKDNDLDESENEHSAEGSDREFDAGEDEGDDEGEVGDEDEGVDDQ